MSGENIIILFDIPSPWPSKAWSPNTWKVRYLLNLKQLAYRTEWVEYPDIAEHCKQIGATHTSTMDDGSPYYTLPIIKDLSTGKVISESFSITKYLEETYPDSIPVLPKGTVGLQDAFIDAFLKRFGCVGNCIIPRARLNPRSWEYYVETREKWWQKPLSEIAPKGDEEVECWRKLEKNLDSVDGWYSGNQWIMGDSITFADIVVVSYMAWIRLTLRDKWDEEVSKWHSGRWANMVQHFDKYSAVV